MTIAEMGTDAGAVYTPLEEMVPIVELPPAIPETAHFTDVVVAPATFAVNTCVFFVTTVTDEGLMLNEVVLAALSVGTLAQKRANRSQNKNGWWFRDKV